MSLDDCRVNCTEGEEVMVLDENMLDLCGREMTEQDLQEVEKYRLVLVQVSYKRLRSTS